MLQDVVIANKTYVKLNISSEEQLDSIAVKVIKQDTPEFLLPIKMININGEIEVRYELGSRMRMGYLSESMTKQEFIILLEGLVKPFKICNDWFLDYHNFYLDKDYITVGRTYSDVKYVYIPNQSYGNDEDKIMDFFKNFILNINLKDDPMYVMNLYRRLNERGASLVSIMDYIANDINEESTNAQFSAPPLSKTPASLPEQEKIETAGGWGNILSKASSKEEETKTSSTESMSTSSTSESSGVEFGQNDMRGGLINNLFGEKEEEIPKKKFGFSTKTGKEKKTAKETPKETPKNKGNKSGGFLSGFLSGKKSAGEKQKTGVEQLISTPQQQTKQETEPVMVVPYQDDMDNTFIADEDEPASVGNKLVLQLDEAGGYQFPKYIEIDLNRGFATIGRYDKSGNPQGDYNFDASLSFISKRHLRIEKRGEQCFIIDLAFDKNGTMLNGDVLAANMAYPITSGDRIVFSKKHRITYRVC